MAAKTSWHRYGSTLRQCHPTYAVSHPCHRRIWGGGAKWAMPPELGHNKFQEMPSGASRGRGRGSPYSLTERRVPEMIPVLGSQPAGDASHKPGGIGCEYFPPGLQLPPQPYESCYQFCCLVNRGTMVVNSLPNTVTRQRRGCDVNPGLFAPESSTLTTRLPSHPGASRIQENLLAAGALPRPEAAGELAALPSW